MAPDTKAALCLLARTSHQFTATVKGENGALGNLEIELLCKKLGLIAEFDKESGEFSIRKSQIRYRLE